MSKLRRRYSHFPERAPRPLIFSHRDYLAERALRMFIPILASLYLYNAALADAHDPGDKQNQIVIMFTSAITFLTVLLNFIFQWLRDGRDRKWKEEDRSRHEEAQRFAEASRQEIRQQVDTVDKKVDTSVKEIAENTKITQEGTSAAKDAKKIVDEKVTQRLADIDAKIENKFKAIEAKK